MSYKIKFGFVILVLIAYASVSFADQESCTKNCEGKFGQDGAYRTGGVLIGDAISECNGATNNDYLKYLQCVNDAGIKKNLYQENCRSYLTDPCYGECQSNYNTCMEQWNETYKNEKKTCLDIYLDSCLNTCTEKCSFDTIPTEDKELVCMDYSCKLVAKGTRHTSGDWTSCLDKNEGDVCGGYVGCFGNMCKVLDYPSEIQKNLCDGKLPGANCCEPAYVGPWKKEGLAKPTEIVVKASLWPLECSWTAYEWFFAVPYNEKTCKYDYSRKEIHKFLAYTHYSSNDPIDYLFCGWGGQAEVLNYESSQEHGGQGSVKG
ncbi:hypothetical protein HZC07_06335 [Candidatus Micrarchaeota archaeon]|nr:hypothetical protein [Candidatus Micrarchaeota archaeon]